MKFTSLGVLLLLATVATASDKPCIGLDSDSEAPELVRQALSEAVTLSGDFTFYPTNHAGCWTVHEVSYKAGLQGYAISWAITDPANRFVRLGLNTGPDAPVFDKAMRSAAAAAIQDIRAVTPH